MQPRCSQVPASACHQQLVIISDLISAVRGVESQLVINNDLTRALSGNLPGFSRISDQQ